MATGGSDDGKSKHGIHRNRLADEKSPYLLQHAGNPKAKEEDKPIFLSIGYSTCHWCHVMERESFENEEVGKILNDNFVAIKVDREERPDVDRVYMTFIQATSGGGGWPMSVWLTPDLKPMVGGTYFPPDDRYYGRPGFKSILLNIAAQWKAKRDVLDKQGTAILDALMQGTSVSEAQGQTIPDQQAITKCYEMLEKSYDTDLGGFGKAPKFPQPVNFNFLFRMAANNLNTDDGKNALDMCATTLHFMNQGGIHDHVSQVPGFHRYSTDRMWHVPHFEKMLYDQGQLLVAYSEAYQAGGFYSAEDADSYPTEGATEKKEGAFCVWTFDDINTILSENVENNPELKMADVFCYHFGVEEDGNVDPLQNVLMVRGSVEETARHFVLSKSQVTEILDKCKSKLYDVRQTRPKPHLDDKMLTSWNGLMISGLAKAGQVLGDEDIIRTAVQAAEFLKANMYNSDKNILYRSCYTGLDKSVTQMSVPIEGFADDYANLIRGLLDLYEATFDDQYVAWAEKLQDQQNTLFWDTEGGGYFNNKEDPSVVFYERLTKIPVALPEMMTALIMMHSTNKQIVLVGDKGDPDLVAMVNSVNSHFLPNKVVIVIHPQTENYLCSKLEFLQTLAKLEGKSTAYVCENYTCSLPVNTVEELDRLLSA
ncbi:hypothetical protein KUTeg_003276 [Tegillarca granosa]|uniref:Spermatogenesis-associated protein 20-like TRX domain-containing protein n=1 Tax=Tegillarca granosa TaxID=220873 RepID=A0ABQ9FLQ0_TEGGR|nr:hypothetical protein KUTeg_003276 [Tegillarca granosa]